MKESVEHDAEASACRGARRPPPAHQLALLLIVSSLPSAIGKCCLRKSRGADS
jgi:hypothetical protein